MKKVTGIGGVFFKSDDPEKLKEWYGKNLGFEITSYGSSFLWRSLESEEGQAQARTEWSPFKADTNYFEPSKHDYMINYRVENLDDLLAELKEAGVEVLGGPEKYEYGSFAWIMDPEGRKIELWEPIDGGF
jgi:D-3-phosphoglycerate dehydrogenase / 2-oxoglutarate reductase